MEQINSNKEVWRVLPFKTSNGISNMAIDEAILRARADEIVPNTIRFYRWKPSTATIGRNQSLSMEIDIEAAEKLKIDYLRRISGGGAVFHDYNNEITYAVIASEKDIRKIFKYLENKDGKTKNSFFNVDSSYNVITQGLVNGLIKMGVQVDRDVLHCPAMFINDRKISGNAQARRNNIILQHGTILLHVDAELMYTILKAPEGVTKGKMVRSVRAKVTGLYDNTDIEKISDYEFQIKMIKGFEEALNIKCEMGDLTEKEKNLIEEIKKNRYSDNKWLQKIP
ncbi:MAG: lipoate--protein ligase family protein [archaeon]|nr:lipoate--protein ligase family protein [archaeon]